MDPELFEETLSRATQRIENHRTRKISQILSQETCYPTFKTFIDNNRATTICKIMVKDNVLSSGEAFQSPEDKYVEMRGKNIALARAVRNLVAKRLGIQK